MHFVGMWIRYRFEKGARIMKAIIVPFTLLTVLFIFTVRQTLVSPRVSLSESHRRFRLAFTSIFSYSCWWLVKWWRLGFSSPFVATCLGPFLLGLADWSLRKSLQFRSRLPFKMVALRLSSSRFRCLLHMVTWQPWPPWLNWCWQVLITLWNCVNYYLIEAWTAGLPLWVILGIWKSYQRWFMEKPASTEGAKSAEFGAKVDIIAKDEEKELLSRLSSCPDSTV